MTEVGAYQAKTHLPELLTRVAKGERITITRHGAPVAMLVPPPATRKQPVTDTITELRRFRLSHALGDISLKELIEEGRR